MGGVTIVMATDTEKVPLCRIHGLRERGGHRKVHMHIATGSDGICRASDTCAECNTRRSTQTHIVG